MGRRRVCFVTGTRAEFGLMRSTLGAIAADPSLQLQIIATGMHLDRSRGKSIDAIRSDGWTIDAVVPWRDDGSRDGISVAAGRATAGIGRALARLDPEVVLVAGDRVEAFAAASAAHLAGRIVAHVHGGDRALGIVDDALRHAITKLAHVHFPATATSATRIAALGEDPWRIHRTGSPGLDDLRDAATALELKAEFPQLARRKFALLVLHPASADSGAEARAAKIVLAAVRDAGFEKIAIVYPNNDPGSAGIVRCWDAISADDPLVIRRRNLPRPIYLGLLRDAAALVGNSSSGIIEAGSFGTPAVDIGPRQTGRERGENVLSVPLRRPAIDRVLAGILSSDRPVRFRVQNPYVRDGRAGAQIARTLSRLNLKRHVRKLISY